MSLIEKYKAATAKTPEPSPQTEFEIVRGFHRTDFKIIQLFVSINRRLKNLGFDGMIDPMREELQFSEEFYARAYYGEDFRDNLHGVNVDERRYGTRFYSTKLDAPKHLTRENLDDLTGKTKPKDHLDTVHYSSGLSIRQFDLTGLGIEYRYAWAEPRSDLSMVFKMGSSGHDLTVKFLHSDGTPSAISNQQDLENRLFYGFLYPHRHIEPYITPSHALGG